MALAVRSGALTARSGFRAPREAAGLPAAGVWLLLASLPAAAAVGALVPRLGAGPSVSVLVGGIALAAAASSSYAALALLIVLLLVPIGVAGELPAHVNELDAVYGAALVGLALRMLTSHQRLALNSLGLALVAFMVAGVLALVAGLLGNAETATAMSHFRGLFGYALIPALVLSLGGRTVERRGALVYALCAAGVLTAVRGVLSWAQLNGIVHLSGALHRIASPDSGDLLGVVPAASGQFGYVRAWAGNFEGNTLGALVVLLLPVAAYLAMRRGKTLVRIGFGAGVLVLALALLASYSRGAYLGLAGASVPAMVAMWRRHPAGTVAIALAGGALLFFLATQLPGAEDRLVTLRALSDDPTVQHRQLVYGQIVDSVVTSPIWGIGLGSSVGAIGTGADSLYLFVILRGGLLMTIASVVLVWVAAQRVLMAARAGYVSGLELALAAGLFGFAVHSVVDYTIWNPKVALTAWLLAGFLMAPVIEKSAQAAGGAVQEPAGVVCGVETTRW